MLPVGRRLTTGPEIQHCIRRGVRSSGTLLTVHLLLRPDSPGAARAGFVVGRAVGGSVVRHRVQRRLRHQIAPLLAALPQGSCVVVRAHPAAATSSSDDLGSELRGAMDRALARSARAGSTAPTPGGPR